MKISGKLIIAFLAIAALTLFVGVMGITNLTKIDAEHEELFKSHGVSQGLTGSIEGNFLRYRIKIRDMIMDKDVAKTQGYVDDIKTLEADMQANLDKFKTSLATQEELDQYNTLTADIEAYNHDVRDKITELCLAGKYDEAYALIRNPESIDKSSAADDIVAKIINYEVSEGESESKRVNAYVDEIMWLLIGIVAVAVILAMGLGIIIARSISRPISAVVKAANRLAAGDANIQLEAKGRDETAELGRAVNEVVASLQRLIADTNMLSAAALAGKLGTRANAAQHEGDYRKIVEGVNQTLDAVIGPLSMAASYVERISRGDIPEKITDSYNGDFDILKTNLNTCIDAVNRLVDDTKSLVQSAVEGRLSTRADASRHQGDFMKIVDGVNKTLDAVIEPITEASAVLSEMSKGNLSINVMGSYKGDHAVIKNALNDTINTIKGYIGEISEVLSEIADGNLVGGITGDYRGEFVVIKESINHIVDSLNNVLGEINAAAEQVAAGTQQVSSGSQALSQGATEQASAIEELNASVSEIAEQTRQNAVNAGQANELAQAARANAASGNDEMKEMQKAMAGINEASASISKIIKVIDDIAFQTNLLALNAAVEAARAGQYGKGFAVVAEEVRSLAQRSAAAAKETTALIEESVKKVQEGTVMADETAQALQKIVGGVEKATDLVSGIAKASSDQATAVAQVNRGIEQVAQVVQTNSATAEESAAASEELSSQATLLKEMVGRFSLKGQIAQPAQKALPEPREKKALHAQAKPSIALSSREFGKY